MERTRAAFEGFARQRLATNSVEVELTRDTYERARKYLKRYFIQRVELSLWAPVRFLLGDSPVVVSQNGRVSSADDPVAIGDADEVFMPLSPTVAAAISTRPVDHKTNLNPDEAHRINRFVVDSAQRFFIGRSADDLYATLGSDWCTS